jgi:transcription termination factor NusB
VTLSRRAARRTALFLLYQWDVTGRPLASLYEGEVDEFARRTAEAVAAEAPELDRRITEAADEWTAEHPGTVAFPIEEGFELGRRWIAHKWGIGR